MQGVRLSARMRVHLQKHIYVYTGAQNEQAVEAKMFHEMFREFTPCKIFRPILPPSLENLRQDPPQQDPGDPPGARPPTPCKVFPPRSLLRGALRRLRVQAGARLRSCRVRGSWALLVTLGSFPNAIGG
jgi:hypothetical protein